MGGVNYVWGDIYEKITSTSGLQAGEKYLLVYENGNSSQALGAISNTSTKYGVGVPVIVSNSVISISSEEVAILTLEASSTNWKFKSSLDNKYLHWSSGNSLSTDDAGSDWTVSFSNGVVNINHAVTTTRVIKYNTSNPRFACYTSGQTAVALYKKADVPVSSISLNKNSVSLKVGENVTLIPTVLPDNASDKTLTWTSSNESVATVSSTGVVKAVAVGNVTITATSVSDGTKMATCGVNVVAADAISLPTFSVSDGASLELGSTVTITAETGCTLEYQIGTADKVAVGEDSKEITLSTVGDVTLKAWAKKEGSTSSEASINLTVTKHPISLSFSPDAVSVVRGGNVAAPELSGNTGSGTVTYSSDDETIATVNSSTGVVTGVKAGNTTITATVAETAEYLGGSATFSVTVTKPYHTVTFSVNGNTSRTAYVQEDATITFPTAVATPGDDETKIPEEINGMTFVGWYGSTYTHASTAPEYVSTSTTTMGENDVTYYAVYADRTPGTQTTVTDDLTLSTTGVTGTSYTLWSGKSVTSSAVYAGNSAGGNSSIQLRSNNNDSGIISTTSGGKVKKVVLVWNSNTSNGRTVDIYGKNSAYSEAADTYDNNKQGTKLGSIVYGTSTELDVTGDYTYVGLCSKSGALYLDKVSITWETGTPDTYSNFCTTVSSLPRPVLTVSNVDMVWGEAGKKIVVSATVNEEAVENATYTYTSSDDTKLTVAADGTISCSEPGTYTVTTTIVATEDYQAASVDCTVTVNKKDVTLEFVNAIVNKLTTDESHTQNAIVTPAAYDGTIAYTLADNTCGATNTGASVSFTTSGSVTVNANAPATDLYNAAEEVSYVLNVSKVPAATITALNISSVGAGTNGTLSATYTPAQDCETAVSYATSNALILSVDGTAYHAESGGNVKVTVTVTPDDTDVYETVSREFDVTVTDTRTLPTFTFSASEVRVNLVDKELFVAPTLDNNSDGVVVYTSSDTDVATVNSSTGAVELLAVGTTTITATVSGSATYQNAEASYTLTIYVPTYTFTKVTDASSLREGDKLIIVNEDNGKAMGKASTNNFGASALTITVGVADGVASNTVSILTLEGTTGAWYFNLNGNYLYAASSSSNQLKTEAKKDDNAKATIAIAEGDATILFQGTNTRNNLRYNSGSNLFSCYSSGQDAIQLYRMSELVTLPGAIYATRCYEHALDFSGTGIKAYTVNVNAEKSTARVTEISGGKVPAGEGVILYAETANTYAVPVIESAAALDNDLVGVTEDTAIPWQTGDKYNYILQRSGSDYAFNKANGAMLAANRAYLQTTYKAAAAGARLALVFDDDTTTGISDASRVDKEGKGSGFEIYNLKGQRVENPVKGQLYIVNGKKVVMK